VEHEAFQPSGVGSFKMPSRADTGYDQLCRITVTSTQRSAAKDSVFIGVRPTYLLDGKVWPAEDGEMAELDTRGSELSILSTTPVPGIVI
jgi:hypothetical protein